VVSFTPRPLFSRERTAVPIEREALVGPKAGVDSCGAEETSPCWKSTPDPSLYFELSWLRCMLRGYFFTSDFIAVNSDVGFSQDAKNAPDLSSAKKEFTKEVASTEPPPKWYFWSRVRKRSGSSHSEMITYLSECVRRHRLSEERTCGSLRIVTV